MSCDGISGQSLIGKLVGTFGENYSQVCQYSNMFTNKIVETNFTQFIYNIYYISMCEGIWDERKSRSLEN